MSNHQIITVSCLIPVLMAQIPAQKAFIELTVCQCKKSKCETGACKCVKAGLSCSPACEYETDNELCKQIVNLENGETMDNVSSDRDLYYTSLHPFKTIKAHVNFHFT